jgi:two-component system chemotaxis response regulator CheY
METTSSPTDADALNAAAPAPVTALIVDDEPHVRAYVRLTLQSLDVTTAWEAADGPTALALYAEHAPTVVLLDVNMPTMPGVETLQQLLELDPNVHVVVVTSDSAHQTVRRFLELGAIGYVLKQRPPEEFRAALAELLAPFAE